MMMRLIRWIERRPLLGNLIFGVVAAAMAFGLGRLLITGVTE